VITLHEAGAGDTPELVRFFLETPVEASTNFVLDRAPDFAALPRLRGQSATFVARDGAGICGCATALWHDATSPSGSFIRVGEVMDLRVNPDHRKGVVAARLLRCVRDALLRAGVDHVFCLIADNNAGARSLLGGRAGFPEMRALTRYACVHIIPMRLRSRSSGYMVRRADASDAQMLSELVTSTTAHVLVRDPCVTQFPQPSEGHMAWMALRGEEPVAGLMAWDGYAVRRIRVMRYSGASGLAAARLAAALPPPGGALHMWATRWLGAPGNDTTALRVLLSHVSHDAASAGQHVFQVNIPDGHPATRSLPLLPRTTLRTTLYGTRMRGGPLSPGEYHADPAMA
jgi:hypothetical protein